MELAPVLLGIAYFLLVALPLLVQGAAYARTRSKYETLHTLLDKRWGRLTHLARHQEGYWIRALTLLDIGEELIPCVTWRLRRRLTLLAAIAFLSSILVAGAVTVLPGIQAVSWFALLVLAANWGLQFRLFLPTRLFSDDERAFLRNLGLLHDTFYTGIVLDVLEAFNARCDETLGQEKEALDQEVTELRDRFLTSLGRPTGERRLYPPPKA
jgi:hypothetical protein